MFFFFKNRDELYLSAYLVCFLCAFCSFGCSVSLNFYGIQIQINYVRRKAESGNQHKTYGCYEN